MVGENCSQIDLTNKTCFQFSEYDFNVVSVCRTGFSIAGAVTSALAILYFIDYKCIKGQELGYTRRLALYLCIASFWNGFITALQYVPVARGPICDVVVANKFCAAAACMVEMSVWTILVLMVYILIEMSMAVLRKMADKEEDFEKSKCYKGYIKITCRDSVCGDVVLIVTTLLISIIFCIIPVITDSYGLAGAWCWIKTRDDDCQQFKAGVIQQFLLWYAWAILYVITFIFTVLGLCCKLYKTKRYGQDAKQEEYCRYLKDMGPLIAYPFIFCLIYGFGFTNRIIYASYQKTNRWLWTLHGIADASVSLVISLYFLVHHRRTLDDPQGEEQPPPQGPQLQGDGQPQLQGEEQPPPQGDEQERKPLLVNSQPAKYDSTAV